MDDRTLRWRNAATSAATDMVLLLLGYAATPLCFDVKWRYTVAFRLETCTIIGITVLSLRTLTTLILLLFLLYHKDHDSKYQVSYESVVSKKQQHRHSAKRSFVSNEKTTLPSLIALL
mmetsp:Transcript_2515/g.5851  ORF Transcript_2515/g.5851 Transcript_2515/m.5851 type:complete len:118 (-) Transcript_2515:150-503(-)